MWFSWLLRLLKWFWRALSIFMPMASVLWGVSVFGGMALSLSAVVYGTYRMVSGFSDIFSSWADSLSSSVSSLFDSVNSNSYFQLFSYVFSIDVPFDWFRSVSDSFIRVWLTYFVGSFLAIIEIGVCVVAVYWVRSRMKKISEGANLTSGFGSGAINL